MLNLFRKIDIVACSRAEIDIQLFISFTLSCPRFYKKEMSRLYPQRQSDKGSYVWGGTKKKRSRNKTFLFP